MKSPLSFIWQAKKFGIKRVVISKYLLSLFTVIFIHTLICWWKQGRKDGLQCQMLHLEIASIMQITLSMKKQTLKVPSYVEMSAKLLGFLSTFSSIASHLAWEFSVRFSILLTVSPCIEQSLGSKLCLSFGKNFTAKNHC